MDPTDVLTKTPAGQDEVATRARQLPAKLRSLLIMVDGKRSVGEMLAHHPAADEARASLAALLEAGLLALVPKPAAAPSPAAAPAAAAPALKGNIATVKKYICTALHDALGPDADLFTPRVEAATSLEALMTQAEKLREVLRGASGAKRADAFWTQLGTLVTSE
ncbi:MAG TPA: hypothetical protein VM406_09640 [Noviherbaspirillum sp.]|nr:hypothetical protein [Noviherbaspirillum sp.]